MWKSVPAQYRKRHHGLAALSVCPDVAGEEDVEGLIGSAQLQETNAGDVGIRRKGLQLWSC